MSSTPTPQTPKKCGRPWLGPRRRVEFKLPLTEAELLRVRARGIGLTINDYIAGLVTEALRR